MQSTAATQNGNLDDASASVEHAQLIREKGFLRRIYLDNYRFFAGLASSLPAGKQLELGSGGGLIKEVLPNVITSDVVPLPTADMVVSAIDLPFEAAELSAIFMVNVLHHIQDAEAFFDQVLRCLKPGGIVGMIEPANTLFSRFIYQNFHHEPFEPSQQGWKLKPGGRMSAANDALPWIIFQRDRKLFEQRYPKLQLEIYRDFMPLRYILSGGVSKPQLVPTWSYSCFKLCEDISAPLHRWFGLFSKIVVRRLP